MPGSVPLVRLFVSSTFLDFEAERNALHTRVFPRLRAACAARGLRFQPIDLRWGISDAAAAEQLTLPLCLQEIARCQRTAGRPNFLALIGDRYGWRPPPAAIPDVEFERVLGAIDGEAAAELVRSWYRRDDNARPAEYRLRPRADAAGWRSIEAVLTRTLREAARRSGLGAEARLKYEASATEQEIVRAVLGPDGDPGGSVCVVRRRVGGEGAHDGPEPAEDAADGESRLRALVARLAAVVGDRLLRHDVPSGDADATAGYLDRFCEDVGATLERAVLEDGAGRTGDGPGRERASHAAFAAERRHGFVGRARELADARGLLEGTPQHPVLVVGPSGSGKSAFMARLEAELRARPDVCVVARFAGASPLCSTWPGLVASLLADLRTSDDAHRQAGSSKSPDASLARLLRAWSATPRLVLLVDAIDQLEPSSPHLEAGADAELAWLPRPLPAHLQVVVSVTDDRAEAFEARIPEAGRIRLGGLDGSDAGALLDAWLESAGRTVRPRQRAVVLEGRDSGLPLYLRLAADACLSWTSDHEPEALAPDLAGLVRQRLDRLVAPHMHGPMLVGRALGYLACSRSGLAEDELIDLLSGDPAVHDELIRTARHALPDGRVPVVLWARLYQDLVATLTHRLVDGDRVLTFYHRQLEAGVRERFVAGGTGPELHARLALHFERGSGPRALAERPYQQASSGRWASFRETMSDLEYLIARTRAHGTAPLIHDFGLDAGAAARSPEGAADLDRIRRALELSAHAVEHEPAQLRTHLLARLPAPAEGPIARLRRQIGSGDDAAWVEPLRVSVASVDSPLVRSLTGQAESLVALVGDASGRALVTADERGVLDVWSVAAGQVRRTLGSPGAGLRWLRAGPDLRAVAAGYGGDRACLWDVEAGVLVDEVAPATDGPLALSPDGSRLAMAPQDGGMVLWDLASARVAGRAHADGLRLATGCFTRDGRTCVVADRSGRLLAVPVDGPQRSSTVWQADAEIGALFAGPDDRAVVVVLARPSRREYSYVKDLELLVLDLETASLRWRAPAVLEAVWCAPDGTAAVGRAPGELMAFDLRTHERRWLREERSTVTEVLSWAPSAEHALTLELEFEEIHYSSQVWHHVGWMAMATGRRDGDAVVRIEANKGLHVLAGAAGPLGTACIVEDTVHFTAPGGSSLRPIATPGTRMVGVAPVDGGRRIATASSDGTTRVWTAATGDRQAAAPAPIRAVSRWSGTEVVVVRATAVERLDVETWSERRARETGPALLSSAIALAAASANGAWVAYLDANTIGISHQEMYLWPTEELVVWDVARSARAAVLTTRLAGGAQIDCSILAVDDEGRLVAMGISRPEAGGAAAVWRPGAGQEPTDVEARPVRLGALALTSDGALLATAWLDGAIVLSDLADASAPGRRRGSNPSPARALAWSPDARFLAWACDDGTISIAPAARLDEPVARFPGEGHRLVYSPDGAHLLAVGAGLTWHRVPDGEVVASLTLDARFVDATFLDDGAVIAGDQRGELHLLALRDPRRR
jgi:WD40 repeat protein